MTLTDRQRRDWLRLYRSKQIGAVNFYRLLKRFGCPSKAILSLPEISGNIEVYSEKAAERELAAAAKLGARMIASCDPEFPMALASTQTAPLLYVLGRMELLQKEIVAIVGTRNASASGRKIAENIACGLGDAGFVIVSGMARGIDRAAHEASLAHGTIAVLAGGIDNIYPPENRGIYENIREKGCILSEMPPGTEPAASLFPRRNRIVSGLSLAVIVIEAAMKSGSLITARLALEQGREICAVPGSPLDNRCNGSNNLIRQGATLVETSDDVIEVLRPMRSCPPIPMAESLVENESYDENPPSGGKEIVMSLLSPTPVTVDEILNQCQLSPSAMSTILLEMELSGQLERHPGGRISLSP